MIASGIVFVDKPEGWTSHDVVAKMRRLLGTRKIGHAGTLDPMATGLLTLGVGSSTRLLTYLVGLDKTYTARMRLGIATKTDDREGEIDSVSSESEVAQITEEQILVKVGALTGKISQIPSSVSAKKIGGKKAYDLVRDGQEVQLKPREVTIHNFEVHNIHHGKNDSGNPYIDIDVTVSCSSGTYIRALARDLGRMLGLAGGHLTALRRTEVGPFKTADVNASFDGETPPKITSANKIAAQLFEVLQLSAAQAVDLRNGKRFDVQAADAEIYAAFAPEKELVGLVTVKNGVIRTLTNFPLEEKPK